MENTAKEFKKTRPFRSASGNSRPEVSIADFSKPQDDTLQCIVAEAASTGASQADLSASDKILMEQGIDILCHLLVKKYLTQHPEVEIRD